MKKKYFLSFAFIFLAIASCSGFNSLFGGRLFETYSLVPTEGLSTTHIPNESFFYVNLSASYYVGAGYDPLDAIIYSMDEGPGVDCKIPVSAESTEDLYCILDVMEGDLWFHKMVLEYNVPSGMCDYLGFDVPWHLNQKIGQGPEEVHECSNFSTSSGSGDDDEEEETETRYCLGACIGDPDNGTCRDHRRGAITSSDDRSDDCDSESECETASNKCGNVAGYWDDNGTTDDDTDDSCKDEEDGNEVNNNNCNQSEANCEDIDNNCGGRGTGRTGPGTKDLAGTWSPASTTSCRIGEPQESAEDFCGDLDLSENNLANCCLGDYTLCKAGECDDAGSERDWGGDFGECIGGPGRTNWDHKNKKGAPIGLIENTKKEGLKKEYETPALVEVYDGNVAICRGDDCPQMQNPSFITANWWEEAEDKEATNTKPEFYKMLKQREMGDNQRPYTEGFHGGDGYPYFTWSCLDKAREIKHRIHLLIREWNTQEEFNRFKETRGSRGDPDEVGEEGSACEYYSADEPSLLKDTKCDDAWDADRWDAEIPNLNRRKPNGEYNPYPQVIYKGGN